MIARLDKVWMFGGDRKAGKDWEWDKKLIMQLRCISLPTEVEIWEEAKSWGWRDLIKKWKGWVTGSSVYTLLELSELDADSTEDKHNPTSDSKNKYPLFPWWLSSSPTTHNNSNNYNSCGWIIYMWYSQVALWIILQLPSLISTGKIFARLPAVMNEAVPLTFQNKAVK